MIRRTLSAIALLACALSPAQAQEPVINVYFAPLPGSDLAVLNKAIQDALSQPPLQLAAKPFAGAVVVSVDGRVQVTHKKVTGSYYDFTVNFSRDGNSLGQSAQSCSDRKLSDCTDQLVLDVKSVAAPK